MHVRIGLLAALVAMAVVATPDVARADDGADVATDVLVTTGLVVGTTFSAIVGVGASITLIGSGIQLSRARPKLSWSIASFVLGPVALLLGGGMFFASRSAEFPTFIAINGTIAAIGAANILFAVLNVSRDQPGSAAVDDDGPSVAIAAVAIAERGGGVTFGPGLRIANF